MTPAPASLDVVRALGCPECGDAESLATLETLEATAACRISRDAGGVHIEHDADTDVNWDSSTTIGITCLACGYEYQGEDWEETLTG